MPYSIKELYYTIQGEGAQSGRAAIFCRFAGCNLWTGRESDRATAICDFCDTDFLGTDGVRGGKYATPSEVIQTVQAICDEQRIATQNLLIVFTGGEPLLQLDEALIAATRAVGLFVAVETNGTLPCPAGVDWLCVSPKAGTEVILRRGQELKLVVPQTGLDPQDFTGNDWEFEHYYLQPMDGTQQAANTQFAVKYCLAHPRWKISLQQHKILGLK
jgi:7-carboxy-7-deazaguanine synthase